ncbi:MFS transporter [Paenibacillus sp. MBLB4367]|uniref:MFS transporter n=1 Tax=Paenibacillus sp. MBLB4367 TaxID=3384767 RepID=UPI003908126A
MLIMNFVSAIIFIYIGIFVNLYIWEANKSIFEVSWYNLVLFTCWGISYALGANLLWRYTIRLLLALSAGCGAIAFLLLTYLTLDNRLIWIALIGLPVGFMWGFFASAQNLSIAFFGKGNDVAVYFATASIISQTLSMLVPILSAQVIEWFGYGGSFTMMFAFLIVMLAYSSLMPRLSLPAASIAEGGFWLQMKASRVFWEPGSKWLVLAILVAGIFLQFQNLFALLFTFTVTQSKLLIALLNALYTISSLLGLLMYKRIKWSENTFLWIGVSLLSAGFLMAMFPLKPVLIASNLLTTLGMFFFGTVWNAQQFRCIRHYTPGRQATFLVWREVLLCVTRCLMLVTILSLDDLKGGLFYTLIAITLASLLSIPVFQTKASKEAARIQQPSGIGPSL